MRQTVFATAIALAAMSSVAFGNDEVSTNDKVMMQVAMQQAIDRGVVDGKYLYFDAASGEVRTLYPAKAHPMILRMGEHFILCSDFRDESGTAINVDFYVAARDDGFVILDTVIDNREPIERMMKAGLVSIVR